MRKMKVLCLVITAVVMMLCLNACGTMQFNGISVGVNKLAIDQERYDQRQQQIQQQQMQDMQMMMRR